MTCTWLTKCTTVISEITLASRRQLADTCGAAVTPSGSLVDDIDVQSPDAGDLDLDLVAALHPEWRLAPKAHTIRRARGNNVARLEPSDGRKILDDGGDVEDHVVGRVVLHHGTVEPRRELERLRIGNDVARHHPGAERAGRREVLARRDRVLLEIAHARIEEAGVARDHIERPRARHVPAALADHHGKLALEIEVGRGTRPHDVAAMPHQCIVQSREDAWLWRQRASDFARVARIVEDRKSV